MICERGVKTKISHGKDLQFSLKETTMYLALEA
jgi:hypothetical protein